MKTPEEIAALKEKGWRVQSTEKLDWSNPEDFDAYMKKLAKPQEKVSALAKGIGVGVPLWGAGLVVAQKMERKATVNKIKAMENIANLIGDTVSAASAVKAGESYMSGLTESQRKYAETQNGEGYTITLVNQIMGKGFLDDIEGTRGNGFHSVADLQNMPQWKKDELKAAIDANNQELQAQSATKERRIKITNDAELKRQAELKTSAGLEEAAKIVKAQKADPVKAAEVAAYVAKGDNRDTSWSGGQVVANQSQPSRKRNRTQAKAAATKALKPGQKLATGGRARGGLMKKPKKK